MVFLYLCPDSHHLLFYQDDVKECLAQRLIVEEINTPPDSVSTGHGYLQHAGAHMPEEYCSRYNISLIPKDVQLESNTYFAYGNILRIAANVDEDKAEDDSSVVVPGAEISRGQGHHYSQAGAIPRYC